MQETSKSKINKIKTIRKNIFDNEKAINEIKNEQKRANAKFEQTIQSHEQEIISKQSDILDIKQTVIKAELVDIIEELAENWKILPEDISVSCVVTQSPIHNFGRNHSKNKDITNYCVQVSLIPPESITNEIPRVFTCIYNGDELQKDGKPVSKHLVLNVAPSPWKKSVAYLQFDDYKQLITQFTFNDLILEVPFFDEVTYPTQMAEIILNAADKYVEKQTQENNHYQNSTSEKTSE